MRKKKLRVNVGKSKVMRFSRYGNHVSHDHFFLGPLFFWTALPCSGGYHMERGGMPLHDVVGINHKRERAHLLKIKAQCQVYGLRGVS